MCVCVCVCVCVYDTDASMRMHGLKSGKMLKEMRGHTSYINHCTYSMDGLRLVSSGSDGFVKVSLVYFSLL
jgi:hypothetical protein